MVGVGADRGVYNAWNKAIPHANGRWLCFLGADDKLAAQDVMSRMAPHLATAEGHFRVVYGSIDLVDESGRTTASSGGHWSAAGPLFRREMSIPLRHVPPSIALRGARPVR